MQNLKNLKEKEYKLTKEEENLLHISIQEYNDLFSQILLIPKKEFISSLEKYILISLVPRNINYPEGTLKKILNIIEKDYFLIEYEKINNLIQKINDLSKLEKFSNKSYLHCNNCTELKHTCGNFLYILDKENYMMCIECKLIYKLNCILLHCFPCQTEYYIKYEYNNQKDNIEFKPATWAKYHCNAVINDVMKCPNCKNILNINLKTKKLVCLKCNFQVDQFNIKWKCIICKKEFISEAKVYNPFEFKIMKMSVKTTLFNQIEAKPEFVKCCNIKENEIKDYKFYHKKECLGILFLGKLNGKKIVVCSKCHMLNYYDNHYWMCPICKKRFNLKSKNEIKNISSKNLNELKIRKEKSFQERNKNNLILVKNKNEINKSNINLNNDDYFKSEVHSNNISGIPTPSSTNINTPKMKSLNHSINKISTEASKKDDFKRNSSQLFRLENNDLDNVNERKKIPETASNILNNNNLNNIIKINSSKNLKRNFSQQRFYRVAKYNSNVNGYINKFEINENHRRYYKRVYSSDKNYINKDISFHNISGNQNNIYSNSNKNLLDFNKKLININLNINVNINNNNNISNILHRIPIPHKDSNKFLNEYNKSPKTPNNSNLINNNNNNINKNKTNTNLKKIKIDLPLPSPQNSSNQLIDLPHQINNNNTHQTLPIFNSDHYKIISQIGEGTFGKIYQVEDKFHKKFAMKKILANSLDEIKAFENEYNLILNLPSSNLVKIYGIEIKKFDLTTFGMYVLMELGICDWEKEIKIRSKKQKFYTESELINTIINLTKTFSLLQKHNISHRDIKPQNVLIFSGGLYKISDFGEAKELIFNNRGDNNTISQTIRGTELYMSPILFNELKNQKRMGKYIKHNTFKSDVFSLGLCFLFASTLTLRSLCEVREINDMRIVKKIVEKYLKNRYSKDLIEIIFNMMEIDEKNRMDFIELEKYLNEKFIKNFYD